MATDPVELVRHTEAETPFTANLNETLQRLANLAPSTGAPYLTLTLDWRPEGSKPNSRAGRAFFDQQRDELFQGDRYEPHTPEFESVSADLEQISAYLDGEIDPAVQGLVVVACSAQGVFEPVQLSEPLENGLIVGPTPSLRALAKQLDDSSAFAVIHADQREAHVIIVEGAARRRDVEIRGNDYPRHQAQGGWSQRRFQMRADERVDAFLREIAQETEHLLQENQIESIVLAGNEQITSALEEELSQQLQQRLVGSTRLDIRASEQELLEAVLPIVEEAERQREHDTIDRVLNGAGPGGGAVTGPDETLTALQAGQVMKLVINDDLELDGWADYSLPLYGVGPVPRQHPAGGDSSTLTSVPLQDELVRLAVQTGAEIEIVRTNPPVQPDEDVNDMEVGSLPQTDRARKLGELGGVAAILRFVLDEDHSTAEV